MKKLLVVLAVLMLAMFALTACGDGDDAVDAGDPHPLAGTVNRYGWEVPEQTLRFELFTGQGNMHDFNADERGARALKDAWLLEHMNVVIDRVMFDNDMASQLTLMLVAGDYPEVITNMPGASASTFASQGRAINLMPYMDSYGYNFTRRMGDYLGLLMTEDGHLYTLPVNWGETPNVAGWDFGIRHDLWLQTGRPIHDTPEEFFDNLVAVLELHPTNEAGERSFAIGSPGDEGLGLLTANLTAAGFHGTRYRHNPDGTFTHWTASQEARDIAVFMNRMWREGMIHPDYLSMTYEDYIAHLSNGRILGNLGTWWHAWVGGHEIWSVENPDWCTTERFMNVTIAWPGTPKDQTRLLTYNFIGANRAIITDQTDQASDILRFINWQASELGNMITGWGPPMESNNWDIAPDGTWLVCDNIMNIAQKNIYFHEVRMNHAANMYNIAVNGGWFRTDGRSNFDMIDPRVTRVSIWDYWPVDPTTGEFADEGINIAWGYYRAPAFDATLYTVVWDTDSQVHLNNTSIYGNERTWWAEILTAGSEADALAALDRAAAHAETLGVRDVELFFQEQMATNRALLGN